MHTKTARHLPVGFLALAVMTASAVPGRAGESAQAAPAVVCPSQAGPAAKLAAREIARYVYLRTGALPETRLELPARGDAIVLATAPALAPEAFVIKTEYQNGRRVTGKINCGGPAYKDWQADPGQLRSLPSDDFYADWARANFGQETIGKVFAAIDGKVPQVTDGGCPSGRLTPLARRWRVLAPQFAFADELESLRPRVRGAGNLARFDYWLNTFRYHRSLAQLRCSLAKPDAREVTRLFGQTYRYLLATVNTAGALAMVVNLENHPGWGAFVAQHALQPWPTEYEGEPRLIVPTVGSVVGKNEAVELTFIVLDNRPAQIVALYWRPLGRGPWHRQEPHLVTRAIYRAALPARTESYEYYLEARTAGKRTLVWPVTAPHLTQTVVTTD
jgi:hypothetical protein